MLARYPKKNLSLSLAIKIDPPQWRIHILWKRNNLVIVRPSYFIFIGYLRKRDKISNANPTHLYTWTLFQKSWVRPWPPYWTRIVWGTLFHKHYLHGQNQRGGGVGGPYLPGKSHIVIGFLRYTVTSPPPPHLRPEKQIDPLGLIASRGRFVPPSWLKNVVRTPCPHPRCRIFWIRLWSLKSEPSTKSYLYG